jgi:hypothetical protein
MFSHVLRAHRAAKHGHAQGHQFQPDPVCRMSFFEKVSGELVKVLLNNHSLRHVVSPNNYERS